MRPVPTTRTNKTYVLLGGTRENDLPVEVGSEDGRPVIMSTWALTDEERASVAAGANIELTVWGSGQPPVALMVVDGS